MMPAFQYVRVRSLEEGIRHLSSGDARVHAGGTDLLGCLRDNVFTAEKVVSISNIKELKGIREERGGLRIGALTTITEVAESPLVKKLYPGLARAALEVGSPQLRAPGDDRREYLPETSLLVLPGRLPLPTEGRRYMFCLCRGEPVPLHLRRRWPAISSTRQTQPLLLSALQATVRITGPKGSRSVPIDQFFVPPAIDPRKETVLAPQEIVTEISIPAPPPGLRSSYRKVRARRSWDFALAGVALALRFEGARVSEAQCMVKRGRSCAVALQRSGAGDTGETARRKDHCPGR